MSELTTMIEEFIQVNDRSVEALFSGSTTPGIEEKIRFLEHRSHCTMVFLARLAKLVDEKGILE